MAKRYCSSAYFHRQTTGGMQRVGQRLVKIRASKHTALIGVEDLYDALHRNRSLHLMCSKDLF